jgi:hypothetical protein
MRSSIAWMSRDIDAVRKMLNRGVEVSDERTRDTRHFASAWWACRADLAGDHGHAQREAVDLGPIEVTREDKDTLPLPPVFGIVAAATGVALIATQRRVSGPAKSGGRFVTHSSDCACGAGTAYNAGCEASAACDACSSLSLYRVR